MDGISNKDRVELLAPVQNKKSIKAVIGAADAIYFGADILNMRMAADNIRLDQIPEIVDMCHEHNIKAYLTTNIIIYENELDTLDLLFKKAKDSKIDAVIVHDMAAVDLARELKIPFHISTQASVSNSRAALFFERLGAERIILARECSLDMIKEIVPKLSTAKIEAFVHGAQCTSISGRCYFSAVVYNNADYSANRGRCLQPCRNPWKVIHPNGTELDYDGRHFFNSKDMCMIEYIPELIEAGIASFKIEGRMRDPYYIETVTKTYREAIDAYYSGEFTKERAKEWKSNLSKIYNRGFSTGFYFHNPGSEDISIHSSGNQSPYRKIQLGKIVGYYRKLKVAKLLLKQGQLKVGDDIIIEGGKDGTYLHQKIKSMRFKNKMITISGVAKPEHPLLLSLEVDSPVKKGDWVYQFREQKK